MRNVEIDLARLQTTVQNDRHNMKAHYTDIKSVLDEILEQTKKTNGRVNRLEEAERLNSTIRTTVKELSQTVFKWKNYGSVIGILFSAGIITTWFPIIKNFFA